MAISGLRWPTRDEYDLAIQHWQQTVLDSDVRGGMLAQDVMGISSFGGANLYVALYKIGDWMIRCFCTNPPNQTPPDIVERYQAIDSFCRRAGNVTALLPTMLVERGIVVGERVLPFIKMPFLAGAPPLGEFIADHYSDAALMVQARDAWLRMIYELEAVPMAHGDLDLTNVLVQQRGSTLALKLIDYDNLWIPELAGRAQTEYGHGAFQHPTFFTARTRPYSLDMDRFAALVIYISLDMLAHRPELYDEWHADESEQLLFSEADYQAFQLATSHITQLRKLSRAEMWPYIDELMASLRDQRMPRSLPAIQASIRQAAQAQPAHTPTLSQQRLSLTQSMAVADWEKKIYNGASSFKPVMQPRPSNSNPVDDEAAPVPAVSTPTETLAKQAQSPAPTISPNRSMRTRLFIALLALIIAALIVVIVLFILTSTHVIALNPGSALRITGVQGGQHA